MSVHCRDSLSRNLFFLSPAYHPHHQFPSFRRRLPIPTAKFPVGRSTPKNANRSGPNKTPTAKQRSVPGSKGFQHQGPESESHTAVPKAEALRFKVLNSKSFRGGVFSHRTGCPRHSLRAPIHSFRGIVGFVVMASFWYFILTPVNGQRRETEPVRGEPAPLIALLAS